MITLPPAVDPQQFPVAIKYQTDQSFIKGQGPLLSIAPAAEVGGIFNVQVTLQQKNKYRLSTSYSITVTVIPDNSTISASPNSAARIKITKE